MTRIFGAYAYGEGPREGCWWDQTCDMPRADPLAADLNTDVAIVGAGFTGLTAALHLARAGVSVVVLEAERVGWGASGRNGGFCCLGGGMASDSALDRQFGYENRLAYRQSELAAIQLVEDTISRYEIDVDRHSDGETVLAHRAKDMRMLQKHADSVVENYGVEAHLHSVEDLGGLGMSGPFHGGLSVAAGFGLNPRKYLAGLAHAVQAAGGKICDTTPVSTILETAKGWALRAGGHLVQAEHVVLATNGYSSEDLPEWLGGRYMPSQSNAIVTRPLSRGELDEAGWTSAQMAYDTRNLLHYFRLMPDRRFLFGMRGGLFTGAKSEKRAAHNLRRDFDRMFPAWQHVEAVHGWSGMVCLARDLLPFVGQVPERKNLWAGMCFHGNGVAMGSYTGALLAQQISGAPHQFHHPVAIQRPLRRFPLGRWRRAVMPAAYASLMLADF